MEVLPKKQKGLNDYSIRTRRGRFTAQKDYMYKGKECYTDYKDQEG
jgi:hypothetical protein